MKLPLLFVAIFGVLASSKPVELNKEIVHRIDELIQSKKWMDLCKLETDVTALKSNMSDTILFDAMLEHIRANVGNNNEYKCEVPDMKPTQPVSTSTESVK